MATGWLPMVAGVGALGLTLLGVIAARAPADATTIAPARVIEFTTAPEATVSRLAGSSDGSIDANGTTPIAGHAVTLAPGERMVLVARLPGYLEDREVVTAATASPIRFHPTPIRGFVGSWRLPTGEVRTLALRDATVTEARGEVARDLAVVPPEPDTGSVIELEGREPYLDPRSSDASCHFSLALRYRYDARGDALELRAEEVTSEVHAGRCIASRRVWGPPIRLRRAS